MKNNFSAISACPRFNFLLLLPPWKVSRYFRGAVYRLLFRHPGVDKAGRAVHTGVHEQYTRVSGNLLLGKGKTMRVDANQRELLGKRFMESFRKNFLNRSRLRVRF